MEIILNIILIIILILIILSFFYCNKEYFTLDYKKNAIVILTRGYTNLDDYGSLIVRNQSIYNNYYSKLLDPENYDIVIFNEGNISEDQQKYIQEATPDMKLTFISIKFYKTDIINDFCPPDDWQFSSGYKNMCYFWSIDFLEYLKDYEYIIRIDEDCYLQYLKEDIINTYKKNNIKFSSAYFQGDDDERFIVGLKELFENYLKDNNLNKYSSEIKCPYTNFMIVNIPYFRNNKNIQEILNKIKESNCIFSNRWGDLPIFGYILTFLVDPQYYYEDKTIKYYHGSHSFQVNN